MTDVACGIGGRAEREWARALALKPDFEQARKNLDAVRDKMKDR